MSRQRVVIVGGGFGGIAAAIELRADGFEDVTILERGPGVGGTWRDNTYPGAACDVPSHLYSFSYAQRRDWSRLCSPQDEILRYLHQVAREHGVDRLVTPDTEVTACRWGDARAVWIVESAGGGRRTRGCGRAGGTPPAGWGSPRAGGARRASPTPSCPRGASCPAPPSRRCPAASGSPVTRSTPRSGITTTTCATSAWRSSG